MVERLIWLSWRAFWIGLGASAVLIAQALAPVKVTITRAPAPPAPSASAKPPAPKSADPILSRNPFDSKTGALVKPKSPRS